MATETKRGAFVCVTARAGSTPLSTFLQHEWLLISPQFPPIALQQACSSGVRNPFDRIQRKTGAEVHMNSNSTTSMELALAINNYGNKWAGAGNSIYAIGDWLTQHENTGSFPPRRTQDATRKAALGNRL
jgi:hypothetical protein